MLNDFGNNDEFSMSGGYQLTQCGLNEVDLKKAFCVMQHDCVIIEQMHATDFSPCIVRFIDKFDIKLALWA